MMMKDDEFGMVYGRLAFKDCFEICPNNCRLQQNTNHGLFRNFVRVITKN